MGTVQFSSWMGEAGETEPRFMKKISSGFDPKYWLMCEVAAKPITTPATNTTRMERICSKVTSRECFSAIGKAYASPGSLSATSSIRNDHIKNNSRDRVSAQDSVFRAREKRKPENESNPSPGIARKTRFRSRPFTPDSSCPVKYSCEHGKGKRWRVTGDLEYIEFCRGDDHGFIESKGL
ncbi:hypothetical protein CRG98_029356 [Punica granatum]|uniref:Uncharacterized protein n=1 Tax=Punica granatum TaxID=22663 RepID=A0A2I0J2J9_PUNGR|nr:hypothetical protein CRG98_029356 [Punica granatum]